MDYILGSDSNSVFAPGEAGQALMLADLQAKAISRLHDLGVIDRAIVNLSETDRELVERSLLAVFVGRAAVNGRPAVMPPTACLVYRYYDPSEKWYIPSAIQHVGEFVCGRVMPYRGFNQADAEAVEDGVTTIELAHQFGNLPDLSADCTSITQRSTPTS